MDKRKLNLISEPMPAIYKNVQNCELAILSISSKSEKLNLLLKNKLLNQMFIVSKFQRNISRFIKRNFDEKETSFLVANAFNKPDFIKKLKKISNQFANTTLLIEKDGQFACYINRRQT